MQLYAVTSLPVAFPQDDGEEAPGVPSAAETAQTLEGVGTLVNGILQGVAALPVINFQNPFKSATTPVPVTPPPKAQPPSVQVISQGSLDQLLAALGTATPAVVAATAAPAVVVTTPVEEEDDDDDLEAKF